jgi:hypothetical protein
MFKPPSPPTVLDSVGGVPSPSPPAAVRFPRVRVTARSVDLLTAGALDLVTTGAVGLPLIFFLVVLTRPAPRAAPAPI